MISQQRVITASPQRILAPAQRRLCLRRSVRVHAEESEGQV